MGRWFLSVVVLFFGVIVGLQAEQKYREIYYAGEIILVPYNFCPYVNYHPWQTHQWHEPVGQQVFNNYHATLFTVIGEKFGKGEESFALPDLKDKAPLEQMRYCIATQGLEPSIGEKAGATEPRIPFLGELMLVTYDECPRPWLEANGDTVEIPHYVDIQGNQIDIFNLLALNPLIANKKSGDNWEEPMTQFTLPDLRDKVPAEGLRYCMALHGVRPDQAIKDGEPVARWPFQGELMLVPYEQCPTSWVEADGRSLRIEGENVYLYSLIGTLYGGSGIMDYKLPDLRGKAPLEGWRYCMAIKGEFPTHPPMPKRPFWVQ